MKKSKADILVVQNKINSDDIEYNRNHVTSLIENYLDKENKNVDLILLPEFFTGTPWYFPGKMHLKGIVDETIPGPTTDHFAKLAIKYNTYIVCGSLVERENEKYYNTATLIDPQGEIVGKTRKVHRFASEVNHIEQAFDFPLYDTPLGKIGIVVCSDFWILEVTRLMALRGADMLIVPAASLVQNIEMTIGAVQGISLLNALPVVYSSVIGKTVGNRGGKEIAIEFKGHSSIISPKGIVSQAKDEECVLYGSFDLEYLETLQRPIDMSKDTLWWGLWGRQPELYKSLTEKYAKQEYSLEEWFQEITK